MKWKTLALLAAVLLVAGLVAKVVVGPAPPPDRERVVTALQDAARAVEHRSPRAVMSYVSRNYRDALGFDRARLAVVVTDALRSVENVQVQLGVTRVDLRGDRATAEAQATVTVEPKKGEAMPPRSHPLRFYLAREPSRRLLVLPTTAWRVTGLEGWQSFVDIEEFLF